MTTTLTSMAILKVNFDRSGTDILDNFVPFLADRIVHSQSEAVSVPDIREAIRLEYGISIPGGVLKTLAKRCAKRGLLRQEAGVLYPNHDKLVGFDLSVTRAETRRRHAALVKLGVQFARHEFDIAVDDDEFDGWLSAFIRDNAAPLLATIVEGHPLAALEEANSKESRFLVGSFVASLQEADPAGFEYLSDVVKGALLASALYFTNITAFSTRLDRLSVYADTTLLLRAVGACGPDLQLYAAEAIALALRLGARVYCFRHTFDEILGVLDACERAVRRGGGDAHGEATEYMLAAGWGQSDVIELKNGFERKLESIGVRIRDKPDHEVGLTLDESRLESLLDAEIHYKNRNALLKDIDSLTAIFRLRRGNEHRNLEFARAIFVTHNVNLVVAARKYMRLEEWDRETIPLAVPDHLLTTLLWLKEPIAAPNLPDHAIVADCFAAMRPDDSLWRRYVEKIEDLRSRETVTEDEYILLRQSMPLRSLIMYETKQDPEAFTEGTAERVLAKARENIRRDALEQVQVERQKVSEKDVQLELAKQEAQRLRRERDAEAQAAEHRLQMLSALIARRVALGLSGVLAGCALVGTILMVPWPGRLEPPTTGLVGAVVSFLVFVVSGLTLYGLVFGGSISTITNRVQTPLAAMIRSWLGRRLTGRP